MTNKIVEFVETHPYGTAAGVAAVLALYVILHNNSSANAGSVDSSTDPNYASEVAAASQYQVAQLQANQAALQSNNSAAVANNQISAGEMVAQLQSQDTLAGISATQETTDTANNLSAQTTQAVSLLQAQVAENTTAAQVAETQINANAYVDIASLPYDSVTPGLIAQVNSNTQQLAAQGGQLATVTSSLNTVYNDTANVANAIGYNFSTTPLTGAPLNPNFGGNNTGPIV